MSHIFDTLRRVESERNGADSRVQSDTVELLGLVGRRFALDPEPVVKASIEPVNRPFFPHEQRLRVVGSPLSVGGKTAAPIPAPALEPPAQQTPAIQPLPPEPSPVIIEPSSPAEGLSFAPFQVEARHEAALLDVQPVVDPPYEVPVPEAPFPEAELQVPPTLATPILAVPSPAFTDPVVPIHAVSAPTVTETVTPIHTVSPVEPQVQAAPLQVAPPPAQIPQRELVPAIPAEETQFNLPPQIQRAVSMFRTALPLLKRISPILDGNFGAAISNLLAPLSPEPPTPPPALEIELGPIQSGLTELKTIQRELGDHIVEHGESIKRIDDQLEMVRMSTDRNTLEQQELIEELKEVGKRVNVVVVIALGLLAVSVALNTALYLHIVKVLQ